MEADVTTTQVRESFLSYSGAEQPLASYLTLAAVFNGALAITLFAAHRRNRLPKELPVADLAGMAFATHKIARLLTKDSATSFLRAPFVRLEEKHGSNSLVEEPRGHGIQRSIGELLTCPECTGQWVAGGLTAGMLHAPRVTRAMTGMFTALAVADLLQFVYAGLKSRA
jgi:hypothetical protein